MSGVLVDVDEETADGLGGEWIPEQGSKPVQGSAVPVVSGVKSSQKPVRRKSTARAGKE